MLGNWEQAAKDLRLAQQIDFNEKIRDLLRNEVEPHAKTIAAKQAKLRQRAQRRKQRHARNTIRRRKRAAKEARARAAEVSGTSYCTPQLPHTVTFASACVRSGRMATRMQVAPATATAMVVQVVPHLQVALDCLQEPSCSCSRYVLARGGAPLNACSAR